MKKVYAKIMTVVPTKSGTYIVVFQRWDTIDDPRNPFHGQRKISHYTCDKVMIKELARIYKVDRIRDLVYKDALLDITEDGSTFDRIVNIRAEDVVGFKMQRQALPRWITAHSAIAEPVGDCYFQR